MSKRIEKTALITGASSGIGEALARRFSAEGYDLVLVARSADKLAALGKDLAEEHGIQVWVEVVDLSRPNVAEQLAERLRHNNISVDVLVNNAGVAEFGAFASMKPERHQEMISLNVTGLTEMLAQFLPPMVTRGHGRIINVSSTSAYGPVPSAATYAATKAYILSLTESLAVELEGTGVSITALCPGFTATNMLDTVRTGLVADLPAFMISKAEDVATRGYKSCMSGKVIEVPGVPNLLGIIFMRAMPKWFGRFLAADMWRKTVKLLETRQ